MLGFWLWVQHRNTTNFHISGSLLVFGVLKQLHSCPESSKSQPYDIVFAPVALSPMQPVRNQATGPVWNRLHIPSILLLHPLQIFLFSPLLLHCPNKIISISSSQSLNISINSYNQIDFTGHRFVLAMEGDSMTVMSRRREIIVYLSTSQPGCCLPYSSHRERRF